MGSGTTKWENWVSGNFGRPPSARQCKTFNTPLQAPVLKLTLCAPPCTAFSMAQLFQPPPPFSCRGKTSLAFPTIFIAPPPLPVNYDQSLTGLSALYLIPPPKFQLPLVTLHFYAKCIVLRELYMYIVK